MPEDLAVAAAGICKRFVVKESRQTIDALDDVSLKVARGGLTALVGPDAAGKTTFLRLVAGLMRPDSGTLLVLGTDVIADPQSIQNRISYMPQRFGLYEDLSVLENLDLYADLHGVAPDQRRVRYDKLLHMTDLARFTARPASKLSGGMKQKLGLACTLVRSPELLLLDEPTVGVDPLSRRELWEIVQQLVDDEQLSVLISTAYLDEAQRCARVYVLHEGKLLAGGLPSEIADHAKGRCFVATPAMPTPARVLQAHLMDEPGAVIDAVPHAGEVRLICARDPADIDALRGLPMRAVEQRLEDGFMVLLRAKIRQDEPDRTSDRAAGACVADQNDVAQHHRNDATQSHRGDASQPVKKDATPPGSRLITQAKVEISPDVGDERSEQNADQPIIDVRDLVRKFGDFTAVDRTTFTVSRGEIFGLLGPNGAGKTTTFRMLCGLLPASSGEAHVAGLDMRTARARARRRIGYVSQKFALYGNLSTLENLRFFGGAYSLSGKTLQRRIDAVIDQFDLRGNERKPAGQLAGGIKQRLAMAVGLLHEPDILFLDEPTSGADPLARRSFWRRITALADQGTTIVITTHFMEEAEYCDRVVIQDAGRLLALGTPDEVRQQAGQTENDMMDMERAFIAIVDQGRRDSARQADKPAQEKQ